MPQRTAYSCVKEKDMCNLHQSPFMNMGFYLVVLQPVFPGQNASCFLLAGELILAIMFQNPSDQRTYGLWDSVLSLNYLQWYTLTTFSKCFCLTAQNSGCNF